MALFDDIALPGKAAAQPTQSNPQLTSPTHTSNLFDDVPLPSATSQTSTQQSSPHSATLPPWLGGGSYNVDPSNTSNVINTGHTNYGNVPTKNGFERDDIVPVSLGGRNSDASNIRLQPSGAADKSDALEKELAKQVKSGQIPLGQARLAILTQKQNQQPDAPKTGFWHNLGGVISDEAHKVLNGFTGSGNDMGKYATAGTKNPNPAPYPLQAKGGSQDLIRSIAELPGAAAQVASSPFLRIGAQVKQTFGGTGSVNLNSMGLKPVQSYSSEVSNDVNSGVPTWLAVMKQVPSVVFDVLYATSAGQKLTSPREATILTSKNKVALESNSIGTGKPSYMPISRENPAGADVHEALQGTPRYNTEHPTFLKVEPTAQGFRGSIVQIRPSLLRRGYNALFSDTGQPFRASEIKQAETVVDSGHISNTELLKIGEPGQGKALDFVPSQALSEPAIPVSTDTFALANPSHALNFAAGQQPTVPQQPEQSSNLFADVPLPTKSSAYADLTQNPEAGFVDPGAALQSAKEALAAYKEGRENARFGEKLRTYFTGERDVRVAETNQLKEKLAQMVKSPVEQEAISLYRDFKNRPGELQSFLDGSNKAYAELKPEQKADALARMQKLAPVIQRALNPTEDMLKVDAQLTKYFEGRLAEGQKLGFIKDTTLTNEEYIKHLIKPSKEPGVIARVTKRISANKISRNFGSAKQRTIPTLLHAIAYGSDVKTINALDALSIYGDQHATAAATHLLIKQLKDTELGKFGSQKSEHIPKDWEKVSPSSELFKIQRAFVDEEGKPGIASQELYAPQKVVDALKPLAEPSYMNRVPGFMSARVYQAYLKGVELSLSFFHAKALAITSLANQGVMGTIKSVVADMRTPAFLATERAFIRAGGTTSILGRTVEAYRAANKSALPTRMDLLKNMPIVKQLLVGADSITHLTFDIEQRKIKVLDFAMQDSAWVAKHMDATEAEHFEAQRQIAKEVNAAYGGLQWENLGLSRTFVEISRAVLLAPDWTYSNFFNAKTAFEGGPGGSAARKFWIRAIAGGVVASQLMSYLITKQRSKHPTMVYFGHDKNGKEIYGNVFFAGAPSDMVNLIENVHQYGAIAGLFQSIASKVGPLGKTAIELYTNRNYFGQQIVPKGAGPVAGTARSAQELGSNLLPIPFSISGFTKMLNDPNKQYTKEEYLVNAFGGKTVHEVPTGMREITSGNRKGTLVPTKKREKNSLKDYLQSGKLYKPIKTY